MKVTTKPPEPHMVLSLRQCANSGVALVATIGEDEQDLMVFNTRMEGSTEDVFLVAHTLKTKASFPVALDADGYFYVAKKS